MRSLEDEDAAAVGVKSVDAMMQNVKEHNLMIYILRHDD
jgi:hypothetical protein